MNVQATIGFLTLPSLHALPMPISDLTMAAQALERPQHEECHADTTASATPYASKSHTISKKGDLQLEYVFIHA